MHHTRINNPIACRCYKKNNHTAKQKDTTVFGRFWGEGVKERPVNQKKKKIAQRVLLTAIVAMIGRSAPIFSGVTHLRSYVHVCILSPPKKMALKIKRCKPMEHIPRPRCKRNGIGKNQDTSCTPADQTSQPTHLTYQLKQPSNQATNQLTNQLTN